MLFHICILTDDSLIRIRCLNTRVLLWKDQHSITTTTPAGASEPTGRSQLSTSSPRCVSVSGATRTLPTQVSKSDEEAITSAVQSAFSDISSSSSFGNIHAAPFELHNWHDSIRSSLNVDTSHVTSSAQHFSTSNSRLNGIDHSLEVLQMSPAHDSTTAHTYQGLPPGVPSYDEQELLNRLYLSAYFGEQSGETGTLLDLSSEGKLTSFLQDAIVHS